MISDGHWHEAGSTRHTVLAVNTSVTVLSRAVSVTTPVVQRTGVQTCYSENTPSFNQWIGSTIQLRSEVRFDRSWDRPGYDNGTRANQFTAAADLIFHF